MLTVLCVWGTIPKSMEARKMDHDYKESSGILYRVEGHQVGHEYVGWIFFTRRSVDGQIEPERPAYICPTKHRWLSDAVDDAWTLADALIASGIARQHLQLVAGGRAS
jgi:hypothetical protein